MTPLYPTERIEGLGRAERLWQRALPTEPQAPVFSDGFVEQFIADFAKSEDPIAFLEDNGVGENKRKNVIGVDVLQALANTWMRDALKVHDAAGSRFWFCMKELASEAFDRL